MPHTPIPTHGGYSTVITTSPNYTNSKTNFDTPQSTSPDLPNLTLYGHDFGKKIKLTLNPEQSVSPFEALQLTMLLMCYREQPSSFCALAYIKKHNLEKHFKFGE